MATARILTSTSDAHRLSIVRTIRGTGSEDSIPPDVSVRPTRKSVRCHPIVSRKLTGAGWQRRALAPEDYHYPDSRISTSPSHFVAASHSSKTHQLEATSR
ncbi:hypothetical protein FKP32DRAFT_948586 [Trametes sanguinea]|nr:hypothetical protein FKP32DRAFT_948586 [Trametes sanguinea]